MKTYSLENDFKWYIDHQDELLPQYEGKILVIRDCRVIESFDSNEEAYKFATSKWAVGEFLIQECTKGNEAYTQTMYTNRIQFA